MPIIVGAPRSGTTLLRLMLDAHPDLAIPPETGFLVLAATAPRATLRTRGRFFRAVTGYPPNTPGWQDFGIAKEAFEAALAEIEPFEVAQGFRAFYRLYAQRMNKPHWGDKTPFYVHHIEAIHGLLPEARFIHIVRDGRDSCLSLRQTWFSPANDISGLAQHWRRAVLAGRRQGIDRAHYLEIRYEDLIADPLNTLRSICRFIGLEFDPSMMRYYERAGERLKEHKERRRADGSLLVSHEQRVRNQESTMRPLDTQRIGGWRTSMTAEEQAEFTRVAGDALRMFGYADDGGPVP